MRGPLDITRELLAAEILHEIVHLPRRIDSAADLPAVLGLPPASCLAVRLFDADDTLVAALLPANATPATSAIARAMRARAVRPTRPDRVSAITDYHPSLVCPVGLPTEVRTVADTLVRDQEVVFAATGDGSTALQIRTADLLSLVGGTVADLVEPGAASPAARHVDETAWRSAPMVAGAMLRR
ncbi:MAG: Cys-tRNA(Pro)/Cys-tRNA(Cys) deacylase [Frankiaceae bacterium]|jgi:prolyl-tRNA editing enzyme YbaK/EbsC (Cys-tRNA(Pro) deacylase)|nr:Cys-tRNA(Pro)/Cys-tRNA(Cys) deacylase [Frankiaceae bacterium]